MADLRVATLQVFAILRVLPLVLFIVRMVFGWQVFGETVGEKVLVLETGFAEEVIALGEVGGSG